MPLRRRKRESADPEWIFDPTKVDVVAASPDQLRVEVIIAQGGPWTGSDHQIDSLQQKIHNYVGFVLDGAMVQHFPNYGRPGVGDRH